MRMHSVTASLVLLLEQDTKDPQLESQLKVLEDNEWYQAHLWQYRAGDLKCIYLNNVMVKKDAPPGTGTRFMEALCNLADQFGCYITLQVGQHEKADRKSLFKQTTSGSRLKTFYARFGFKSNASRGMYQLRGSLHRAPH